MRQVAFGVIAALALGMMGCGSDNGLNLAKVQGKVLYKGEPLPGGEIVFQPDETKGTDGPSALGTISKDGTFVMSTEESGDGAIVGVHKVGISGHSAEPVKGDAPVITESSTDAEVLDAKSRMGRPTKGQTGPTIRDRSGAVFALITPEKLRDPGTSGISIKIESGSNNKTITITEDGSATIN